MVRVAEAQPSPPRFVQASSNAVFGAAQSAPHTETLRADDPMRPCDFYSATKAEAEQIVRSSNLEWVVLRFGGVLSTDLSAMPFNTDALYFESALPDRRPDAQRRRPRCRVGMRGGDDGRRRARDPVDRRR